MSDDLNKNPQEHTPAEDRQQLPSDAPTKTMELREGAVCEWPISRRDFVKGAGTVLGASLVLPGITVPLSEAYAIPIAAQKLSIGLTVNGEQKQATIDSRTTLLDFLREELHLTGTKKGCDHGQCGACTVLVENRRINSCLALAASYEGEHVTTIEGLAQGNTLDPVQQAFLYHDGFQCGYCTPGQIISAVALINEAQRGAASYVTEDLHRTGPIDLTEEEIRERMSGNICRCGAYPGIVAAVRQANQSISKRSARRAEPKGVPDAAV